MRSILQAAKFLYGKESSTRPDEGEKSCTLYCLHPCFRIQFPTWIGIWLSQLAPYLHLSDAFGPGISWLFVAEWMS